MTTDDVRHLRENRWWLCSDARYLSKSVGRPVVSQGLPEGVLMGFSTFWLIDVLSADHEWIEGNEPVRVSYAVGRVLI